MLLRDLTIRHLKRIDTLSLPFRKADGSPREWTVIIGRNGTAKTTILQAIALAAAGEFRANSLIEDIRESLPDKRVPGAVAEIEADFTFGPAGQRYEPAHPMLDAARRPLLCAPDYRLWLRSRLKIRASAAVEGGSKYVDGADAGAEGKGDADTDPWCRPDRAVRSAVLEMRVLRGLGAGRIPAGRARSPEGAPGAHRLERAAATPTVRTRDPR